VEKIDYGPVPHELRVLMESLRVQLPVEKRLIMFKLLALTVKADGNPDERQVGIEIEVLVTKYFRAVYPENSVH